MCWWLFFTSLQVWRDSWWSWRAGRYIQVPQQLCFACLMPRSDYNKDFWQYSLSINKDYNTFGPRVDHKLVTLQAWPRPISCARSWAHWWDGIWIVWSWHELLMRPHARHAATPCFHPTDGTWRMPLRVPHSRLYTATHRYFAWLQGAPFFCC